ncbi:MAG TPA: anaerobic ribonucleoside-triphosphate reductase activating protein [Candidatus Aphodousia gallistercoris]|nr:anaerobic ribonucleoside-triphosphate reductase activating protein [Candidatus Aphodousia gallistercoris]
MNYMQLREFDTTNGPGVRVSLFVSGCTLHCKGCFNEDSWDFKAGHPMTEEVEARIVELVNRPYISGLSVLGGDPFEKENIEPVMRLLQRVKAACPGKTVWVWTGRKYEHFEDHPVMQYIDTLVDGPYIEKLKVKEQGQYFGSTNQRVITIHPVK